jgi:YVTN family beta-propeller protein
VNAGIALTEVTIGARPYGVVISPDGETLYIALQGADQLVLMDSSTLQILTRWPTADRPSGLTLSKDGGTLLISHLLLGDVTVLDLPLNMLFLPLVLGPDSNELENLVNVDAGQPAGSYIPHTLSNSGNASLTLDTTMAPVVSVLDLDTRQHLVGEQYNLDVLDPPAVGLPFDAAFRPDGSEMWVLNAASNDITVINLATGIRIAHIEVGDNPRGIVFSPDGSTVYVNNTLSGTVSVINTATYTTTATIPVTTIPMETEPLTGKRLFNSSDDPRMGVDQWMSCNSCHFDGENDGRTWQLGFAGPRNTTSLHGLADTMPLRWSGEWDEAADAEFAIRMDSFGTGLVEGDLRCSLNPPDCTNQPPHTGLSADLDALAAYISSLPNPLSPGHTDGQPLSMVEERGKAHFNNPAIGCAGCHPAPTYTDNLVHDVGTATAYERIGPKFNTPSLRGLYDSPPYFHDGSALTLYEAVTFPGSDGEHNVSSMLNQAEIAELIAFLMALPYQE